MSPEDRESITSSIANLWTFQTAFMAELLRALQESGTLWPEAIEQVLQRLDASTASLEGADDDLYAASALATVRQLLRAPRA